jgi:hypothetical protein
VENIPAWLNIIYGTEPFRPAFRLDSEDFVIPQPQQNAEPKPLAERYTRTFEMGVVDAMSGEELLGVLAKGTNEDTFD